MSTPPDLILYTFAMSHYSEKIRWTLDRSGLDYQEICLTPVFHIGKALKLGGRGQTTLPVLQTPEVTVQDSPRIIDWLIECRGPLDVAPVSHVAEVRRVEARFDAIGKDVARYLYGHSFGVADAHIIRLWTAQATPMQATAIRLAYPLIRWGFKRKLKIDAAGMARAEKRILEAMAWLESQLADGRSFLVGRTFTVADITAASLLAPIACPDQHPVYGDHAYQEGMAAAIAAFKNRPGIAWVKKIYGEQRGAVRAGTSLK